MPVDGGAGDAELVGDLPDLTLACAGRFGDQHALMCTLNLEHIDHLTDMIARLDTRIDEADSSLVAPGRAPASTSA